MEGLWNIPGLGLLLFGLVVLLLLNLLPNRRVVVLQLPPEPAFSNSRLGCLPILLIALLLLFWGLLR